MLVRRIATVGAGIALGAVAFAGSALAHVEVGAKPAQALAENAVITFSAEAESGSAGIASVRVVLPTGIAPADVTYVSGPAGWQLTTTPDGYSLAGKPLGVHKSAEYAIKVRRLPDAQTVAFKTLVNYSDGAVDRWIELPTPTDPSPEHPAPILKLAAAASPATVPTPAPSDPAAAVSSVDAEPTAGSAPTSVWSWVVVAVMAAIAAALAIALVRRKMQRG